MLLDMKNHCPDRLNIVISDIEDFQEENFVGNGNAVPWNGKFKLDRRYIFNVRPVCVQPVFVQSISSNPIRLG